MNKGIQRKRVEEEGEEEDGDDSRTSKTKTDQRKDEAKRLFLDIKKGASLETISKKYRHLWNKYNAAVMKLWNNVHGNNSNNEMTSKQAKKQRKLEREKKEDPDYKPGDSEEWGIDDDNNDSEEEESKAGEEAVPVCKCDIENDKGKTLKAPAVKRETKSDANGNQGRLFWCCGNPDKDQQCKFFLWDSDWESSGHQQKLPIDVNKLNHAERDMFCDCGVAAVYKKVSKDGPNKGKVFWTCRSKTPCSYFRWDK